MVGDADTGKGKSGRRVSLSSKTDKGTTSFANKTMQPDSYQTRQVFSSYGRIRCDQLRQKLGDSDVDVTKSGIGFTCRKGLKPESPNQVRRCRNVVAQRKTS